MASIVLEDVSKAFESAGRPIAAVDAVSLEVPPGTFASLLGPSGCGKSTVLNMVAGFEAPTTGRLRVGGREVREPGPDRGVVFQEPGLFPWLRVDQNVGFALRVRGLAPAEIEHRVRRILEQVGLGPFARSYPAELSGGMRQRVAIARVLAMEAPILLMDEPFGALDAQTRLLMQEFLLQVLGERVTTVLFVTHDIEEAIFLADRVYIMSARPGRLKARLDVPLPRPRTPDCRAWPAFHDTVATAFGLVREEAIKAMELATAGAPGEGRD